MKLATITREVTYILQTNPKSRNSDSVLYYEFLRQRGLGNLSAKEMLLNKDEYELPSLETVGRCRRKAQELYPALRADSQIATQRAERQTTFEDFARWFE